MMSLADAFYLAAYPMIAGGLLVAVLRRRPLGVDWRALIDTALVVVIAGFFMWVYLVQPILDDPDLSRSEAWAAVAYPLADLLLLAVRAKGGALRRYGARVARLLDDLPLEERVGRAHARIEDGNDLARPVEALRPEPIGLDDRDAVIQRRVDDVVHDDPTDQLPSILELA